MPVYKCPKCGRTVELPAGNYYCKVCGPSAIMKRVTLDMPEMEVLSIKLAELKPQLFCSRRKPPKPPSPADLKPIRRFVINKPEGGLWTSTFVPEGEELEGMCSCWLRWCKINMQEWLPESEDCCWVLYPMADARVVEVDGLDDYLAVIKHYGWRNPITRKTEIDYAKLSKDFDGFHLTDRGFWSLRFLEERPDLENFYAWDAESTVWFKWKFKEVKPLSIVPHTCKIR